MPNDAERTIHFIVPGPPVPQGSTRAFQIPTGKVVTTNKSRGLSEFRAKVALAAQGAGATPERGPVVVVATFVFARPKSHYRSGRNACLVRDGAPESPAVKPDLDRLLRALLDGLTGVAFIDDAQVVEARVKKRYGEPMTFVAVIDRDDTEDEQEGRAEALVD